MAYVPSNLVPGRSMRPGWAMGRDRDDDAPDLRDALTSKNVSTASGVALTYHGYKRTGSILWALAYGIAGKLVPLIAVPVAAAQGFGKKKEGCP